MTTISKSDGLAEFPSTPWPLVITAGTASTTVRIQSLDDLVSRYYRPLLSHLVCVRRLSPPQAEDILHGFLHRKVLEQKLLASANRERGRFRTFLLKVLDNFLVGEIRWERAQKRHADDVASIEENEEVIADPEQPADTYDRVWAQTVLAEAARRMQVECLQGQRDDVWGLFEERLLRPALEGTPPGDYEELVGRLRVASPTSAYNLLVTGKRMFARRLAEVIGEYAGEPQEVAREVRELHAILARAHKITPGLPYTSGNAPAEKSGDHLRNAKRQP